MAMRHAYADTALGLTTVADAQLDQDDLDRARTRPGGPSSPLGKGPPPGFGMAGRMARACEAAEIAEAASPEVLKIHRR
ncbi:hypothetical protein [Streptosporangium sp. NBC_01469]|uniref:hypothetical protein n=1 Tax=Streptosporangium sp. NBC_01469 TaxID=2903898 RepID=UPI002E2A3F6F|nr:hypothetical protein [Streptosporangium sp. NBC_01469]